MNALDWKQKLTSRKLWVAITGFISLILTAMHIQSGVVQQVTAITMAGATLVAYIIGEGLVDQAAVNTNSKPS